MEHKGTTVITSKRLLLRRFVIEDAEAMFHNWASDPDVCRFLTWPPHPDVNVTRRILQNWITSYAQPNFYQWAIALQEHPHNVIGSISVVAQNEELDLVHIGYCLGKEWWHLHITSEAFTAIIPFLFEEVKANRIETRQIRIIRIPEESCVPADLPMKGRQERQTAATAVSWMPAITAF